VLPWHARGSIPAPQSLVAWVAEASPPMTRRGFLAGLAVAIAVPKALPAGPRREPLAPPPSTVAAAVSDGFFHVGDRIEIAGDPTIYVVVCVLAERISLFPEKLQAAYSAVVCE
jgi:hypothetical protein